jgi:hypothetical protein
MWCLHNFLLTKDNMLKRHWLGSAKCYFCDKDQSIEHTRISRIVWKIVYMTFNLPPPNKYQESV